jgi:hypothetical protein
MFEDAHPNEEPRQKRSKLIADCSSEATAAAVINTLEAQEERPTANHGVQKITFPFVLEQVLAQPAVTAVQMNLEDGTPTWIYRVPKTLILPILSAGSFQCFYTTLQAYAWGHLRNSLSQEHLDIYPLVYKLTSRGAVSKEELIEDTKQWLRHGKENSHNGIKELLGLPRRTWGTKPNNSQDRAKKASKPLPCPSSSSEVTALAAASTSKVDSNATIYRMNTAEWLKEFFGEYSNTPAATYCPQENAALSSASSSCAATYRPEENAALASASSCATAGGRAQKGRSAANTIRSKSRKKFPYILEQLLAESSVIAEKLNFRNGDFSCVHRIPKGLFTQYLNQNITSAQRVLNLNGWALSSKVFEGYFYIYPKIYNSASNKASSPEQLTRDTAEWIGYGKTKTYDEISQLFHQVSTASPSKAVKHQANAAASRMTSDEWYREFLEGNDSDTPADEDSPEQAAMASLHTSRSSTFPFFNPPASKGEVPPEEQGASVQEGQSAGTSSFSAK